ncbi:uncharacterized protein LOC132256713 isoform X2 [Phlebotomus argentipes]|uniref:uncharacterized protein LOC132256713 isoform X2 n=1 Tax=Phlebotomus argentipes TaxID=94469 RepID=UPI0028931859|nr:uncharacterized protein LOC132256713 isoform X2 [Phlebotomus argentipes]
MFLWGIWAIAAPEGIFAKLVRCQKFCLKSRRSEDRWKTMENQVESAEKSAAPGEKRRRSLFTLLNDVVNGGSLNSRDENYMKLVRAEKKEWNRLASEMVKALKAIDLDLNNRTAQQNAKELVDVLNPEKFAVEQTEFVDLVKDFLQEQHRLREEFEVLTEAVSWLPDDVTARMMEEKSLG